MSFGGAEGGADPANGSAITVGQRSMRRRIRSSGFRRGVSDSGGVLRSVPGSVSTERRAAARRRAPSRRRARRSWTVKNGAWLSASRRRPLFHTSRARTSGPGDAPEPNTIAGRPTPSAWSASRRESSPSTASGAPARWHAAPVVAVAGFPAHAVRRVGHQDVGARPQIGQLQAVPVVDGDVVVGVVRLTHNVSGGRWPTVQGSGRHARGRHGTAPTCRRTSPLRWWRWARRRSALTDGTGHIGPVRNLDHGRGHPVDVSGVVGSAGAELPAGRMPGQLGDQLGGLTPAESPRAWRGGHRDSRRGLRSRRADGRRPTSPSVSLLEARSSLASRPL